jgi:hypothetical protein
MFASQTPGPAAQITLGTAISLVAFMALSLFLNGCSTMSSALVQCKLDALKVLPDDPMRATVYDAVDVIERVRACHNDAADAGKP